MNRIYLDSYPQKNHPIQRPSSCQITNLGLENVIVSTMSHLHYRYSLFQAIQAI